MVELGGYDFATMVHEEMMEIFNILQNKRLQRLILFVLLFIEKIKAKLSVFNLCYPTLNLLQKMQVLKHIQLVGL
jgi:hypothetical protein